MATDTQLVSRESDTELDAMHAIYLQGGREHQMAPHVVYSDPGCPHAGCGCRMQGIDFQLELHGKAVHDPLVRAWWKDAGFAGRCPSCRGWIHFTIRGKRAINDREAAALPQLPANWHEFAVIL